MEPYRGKKMIAREHRLILDNGCILEEDKIYPMKITLENKDIYELQIKCGTRFCTNLNHLSYKITYDKGIEITNTKKHTPKNIQGVCGSYIRESKKMAKQVAAEDKKLYLDKLRRDAELLYSEYLKIHSLVDLANKYGVSHSWLAKLFKDKVLYSKGQRKDSIVYSLGRGKKPC